MSETATFSVALVEVREDEFLIRDAPNGIDFNQLRFDYSVHLSFNGNQRLLISFGVSVYPMTPQLDLWVSLKTTGIFEVQGFEKIVREGDGKAKLPFEMIANLIAMHIATTRGILFEKTRSAGFPGILFPVANATTVALAMTDQSAVPKGLQLLG